MLTKVEFSIGGLIYYAPKFFEALDQYFPRTTYFGFLPFLDFMQYVDFIDVIEEAGSGLFETLSVFEHDDIDDDAATLLETIEDARGRSRRREPIETSSTLGTSVGPSDEPPISRRRTAPSRRSQTD